MNDEKNNDPFFDKLISLGAWRERLPEQLIENGRIWRWCSASDYTYFIPKEAHASRRIDMCCPARERTFPCAACRRRVVSAFLQVEATFREWMLTQDTDAMPRSRITLDEFHAL